MLQPNSGSQTLSEPAALPRDAFLGEALVLIVDDDPVTAEVLFQQMQQEGYRAAIASNGEAALKLFLCLQPDLVLLDALMPGIDGFECCQRLRAITTRKNLPILMVTSLDDPASVNRAFAAGATDFITKPIHWAVLRNRVRLLIQQARIHHQVQTFYGDLETYVQTYTAEMRKQTTVLYKTLEYEATLRRITEKVRDSLDELQILQTAVQELAWTLNLGCCNAAIYNYDHQTSTVCCEYSASIPGYLHRTIAMNNCPEIYQQLQRGQYLQVCSLTPNPKRGRVAMLAMPIRNGHGQIGDLWLINPEDRSLDELEIRLVEQVANQCAIAIRQARLYQAAQSQVYELERLNALKDGFLSTVSHELRAPMANMRMAIQMLAMLLERNQAACNDTLTLSHHCQKTGTYLTILRNECEREITLINDLLDLQRLEAGCHTLNQSPLELSIWLPEVITSFEIRLAERQQILQTQLAPNLPAVIADPVGVRRIITELISNACKYSPPQAVITIAVQPKPESWQLTVTNTGTEIPAAEYDRIFEKFYRIPSGDPWKQGGTGLGLALVKHLVEHLHGMIRVNSYSGSTTFTVEFPIYSPHRLA